MKAVNEGRPIREKQGPKFKISLEEEKQMVDYLADCWNKGDPRTQLQFGAEIVHFLEVYGLENTFRRGIPGNDLYMWTWKSTLMSISHTPLNGHSYTLINLLIQAVATSEDFLGTTPRPNLQHWSKLTKQ